MTQHTPRPDVGPETEGLRERHKRRTLQALREAGVRLFIQQGFDRTTVDQIAEQAGVSQRTFFRYFPCKEALLFGLEFRERFLDELRRRPSDESPVESLRAATADMWRLSVDTGNVRRSLRQELIVTHPGVRAYSLQLTEDMAQDVAAVIAERLGVDIDGDVRPRVYGQLWAALNRWILHRGRLGSGPTTAIDEFINAARILVAGYEPSAGSHPTGTRLSGAQQSTQAVRK